jgi:hypothetical protein
VREKGVIRSRAVLVAIGINWEGRRRFSVMALRPHLTKLEFLAHQGSVDATAAKARVDDNALKDTSHATQEAPRLRFRVLPGA